MLVGAEQGVSAFRFSLYVDEQALSLFFMSSYSAQRLADFASYMLLRYRLFEEVMFPRRKAA